MSIKQNWDHMNACTYAVIKTDLKSLLSILSCQNNPTSTKMSRMSHTLYALPFKWTMIHVPGHLNNIADYLSRNYTHLYNDKIGQKLEAEDVVLPDSWSDSPAPLLTMKDLLEAMRHNILHIEKSSPKVQTKKVGNLARELQ